jgi:hypothetical protein
LDFLKHGKDATFFNFFLMKNMLGKFLGFGRMQQNIFFLFENVLKFFIFEIFRRKPGILIPNLYFTV